MKKIKTYPILILLILTFFVNGCVEEIDLKTITFESALVVEAILTNELKHHEITLSRTFSFEEGKPSTETDASVYIIDNLENTYNFTEINSGKYRSTEEFAALPNHEYQLVIKTNDGKTYQTVATPLTQITPMGDLYPSLEIDNNANPGISIYVDTFDPTGNSKYYRYEYEETYKIVAPFWSPRDFVITNDSYPWAHELQLKTTEQQTCYNSVKSNTIIQTQTTNLSEDKVSKFTVRYIPKNNPIISHRYSIFVKQYVQSLEAHTYYKTLNKFAGSTNVFSQTQPGFIYGNIVSVEDKNEKVIGIFEVSSVSSKRIFLNYTDFFTREGLPPYFIECETSAPLTTQFPRVTDAPDFYIFIMQGSIKYVRRNLEPQEGQGPYIAVTTECGDCTTLGSNIKPDFWE